jgi:LysR family glycine cleavage system transcriptional activator
MPSDDSTGLPAFAQLRAFDAVGRLGGIRRAAQALGIDHAVVSRHLRALEAWAGTQLVVRTRGSSILTLYGQRYHARVSAVLCELERASAELRDRDRCRALKIWCVPGFAAQWLAPRLDRFQSAHGGLQVELRPTDDSPDFSRYEADIDIRHVNGHKPISTICEGGGVRQFEIARPPVFPVASPECAATLGPITDAAQLLRAPLLHEESYLHWRTWFAAQGVRVEHELSGTCLWHAHLTVDAARRGRGVALVNPFLLGDDLARGHLVPVLEGHLGEGQITLGAYMFAARVDRWQAAPVVAFRHWLRQNTSAEV